jgi:hypothetical protein
MGKISSFEEFRSQASRLSEDDIEGMHGNDHHGDEDHHGGDHQYYMFFKNLSAIKHYIGEIEAMDPDQLDNLLKGGHDWAADHVATSKDDIQEVADWVRGEMESMQHGEGHGHEEEPENILVNIEGDEEEVEIEDETEEDEEENDEE